MRKRKFINFQNRLDIHFSQTQVHIEEELWSWISTKRTKQRSAIVTRDSDK